MVVGFLNMTERNAQPWLNPDLPDCRGSVNARAENYLKERSGQTGRPQSDLAF